MYWADSDPRPPNGGNIWYGINSTEALLQQALGDIRCGYPSVSNIDFLLIATWDHIGYHRLGFDKVCVLVCVYVYLCVCPCVTTLAKVYNVMYIYYSVLHYKTKIHTVLVW